MSTTSTSSGWNRGNSTPKPTPKKKPSAMRGIVAGLVVVALAAACVVVFMGKGEKPMVEKTEKKPAKIKEVTPAKVTPVSEAKPEAPKAPQFDKWHGHEIVSRSVVTNGQNVVITMIGADGETYREFRRKNPPAFDNSVDQMLAMVLLNPPGAALPPMPAMSGNAGDVFAEALKKPIVINDDDDERVKKAKLLVQAGREELLEELKRGKTVNQVIEECCAQINDNVKLRSEVRAEYNRLLDSGDVEMAEQYREKANEVLERAGAAQVNKRGSSTRKRKVE